MSRRSFPSRLRPATTTSFSGPSADRDAITRPPKSIPACTESRVSDYAASEFAPAGSISFLIDDDAITYSISGRTIRIKEGERSGDTVVRLSRQAWTDVVEQMRTFINLLLSDQLTFTRGRYEQLADWEPLLRYQHAGIPPYNPAEAHFAGRDPSAVFTLDAEDNELTAQLRTMGYLHVKSVFELEEMEVANREVDRLAALARPDDDKSWWATSEDGTRTLCRLVYATLRSRVLARLENDPRVQRLGTLLDPQLRAAPDRMEGSVVLIKVPGNSSGLSNIPWHQDCGMGGHAIMCPAVLVGIQLTGSDASTGNLQVIPGSHGQAIPNFKNYQLAELPVISIDTAPGDVTVHIQDVMHASPRPTGVGGRRTMYVTLYPPQLSEYVGPGQAYNDLLRNRTEDVVPIARNNSLSRPS